VTADNSDSQISKLVRLVAGIAVIVLLIQFAMDGGLTDLLRQLREISWQGWAALCTIAIATMATLSRAFQVSIQVIGVRLPFLAAFEYSAMNTFFNTVLPMKGGVLVRGLYLKKRYDVTWGSYLFVMATGQTIQLALLAFIAVGFYFAGELPLHLPKLPISAILVAFLGILAVCAVAIYLRMEMILKFAGKVVRGLRLWVENMPRLLWYVVATLAFQGLGALRLWLAFSLVGYTPTLTEICVLYAALAAGLSWAITPGNLGVKEAAIVLLAAIVGINTETALAASIVDRIASLSMVFLIGGLSAYRVSSATASK
jgi:uncharacterized membrane protein YbhN (UPF0104 family)